MKEITTGGVIYRIGNLNAFDQLNMARRLTRLSSLINGLTDVKNKDKDMTLLVVLMLGQLTDEHSDYVIQKSLSAVTRSQNDKFVKVTTPNGDLMFDDIGMQSLIDLTAAVIVENLGDFFITALSKLQD